MASTCVAQTPRQAAQAASGCKRPMDGPADAAASPQRRGLRRRVHEIVGDLVQATVVCRGAATLADVADLLVLHDRTAAAIVDEAGSWLGALTENDIVHAYSSDVPSDCSAEAWLQKLEARLPRHAMQGLTVKPTASLSEAAALMRAQADRNIAFRHLVVRGDGGPFRGILSCLDLTRALCTQCSEQEIAARLGANNVGDVMKPKALLPEANGSATLAQVLARMASARQNCVLVVDPDHGSERLLGMVTPRDALRAFAEHVPTDTRVGDWLRGLQSRWEPRAVRLDVPLQVCAAKMVMGSVHHLVVVSPETSEIVGVLSSTDLAQRQGSRRSAPEIVDDVVHGTVVCQGAATLSDVADLLTLHDRTAAAVVDGAGALLGALTENDIILAYSSAASPACSVGAWLQQRDARLPQRAVQAATLKPTASLLEAAALMRSQADSDAAFRHLVVRDDCGALRGILSSLDLARALCTASSGHEIARRVGGSSVGDVMKPKGVLPVASGTATLAQVLAQMTTTRQNCVLVADPERHLAGLLGVVTPRDALRAFADHVPASTQVGNWLRGLQSRWEPRAVGSSMQLQECAAKMVKDSVHHMVVVPPNTSEVVGVVSSTDLAKTIGVAERVVEVSSC